MIRAAFRSSQIGVDAHAAFPQFDDGRSRNDAKLGHVFASRTAWFCAAAPIHLAIITTYCRTTLLASGLTRETKMREHHRGSRSRSPHRHEHKTSRHRSRSPHHTTPKKALPYGAREISRHDLSLYRPMFALYLDIQKQLDIDDLDDHEVKGRWKSFVGKWYSRHPLAIWQPETGTRKLLTWQESWRTSRGLV